MISGIGTFIMVVIALNVAFVLENWWVKQRMLKKLDKSDMITYKHSGIGVRYMYEKTEV